MPTERRELEGRILEWVRNRHPELSDQIDQLEIRSYNYTGAGAYINFMALPTHLARVGLKNPLSGPNIRSSHLEYGACSLIWSNGGLINCIEVAAYGDRFPEELTEFALEEGVA